MQRYRSNDGIDNLRYTFDYCIFGFPDAKDVASTPCSTETACGELQTALTDDRLKGTKLDYSYCSAGGGAMTGPAVEKCLACVAASDDQHFLANCAFTLCSFVLLCANTTGRYCRA